MQQTSPGSVNACSSMPIIENAVWISPPVVRVKKSRPLSAPAAGTDSEGDADWDVEGAGDDPSPLAQPAVADTTTREASSADAVRRTTVMWTVPFAMGCRECTIVPQSSQPHDPGLRTLTPGRMLFTESCRADGVCSCIQIMAFAVLRRYSTVAVT